MKQNQKSKYEKPSQPLPEKEVVTPKKKSLLRSWLGMPQKSGAQAASDALYNWRQQQAEDDRRVDTGRLMEPMGAGMIRRTRQAWTEDAGYQAFRGQIFRRPRVQYAI
jgi:hypothetical protein